MAAIDAGERPVNRFVADFIGDTNFVSAKIIAGRDGAFVHCRNDGGLELLVSPTNGVAGGAAVTLALRPENAAALGLTNDGANAHAAATALLVAGRHETPRTRWRLCLGDFPALLAEAPAASSSCR